MLTVDKNLQQVISVDECFLFLILAAQPYYSSIVVIRANFLIKDWKGNYDLD